MLSDSVTTPQLNDYGEPLMKPGRRYRNYTEEEYIESLFGRDMARAATTDVLDDKMWQAQVRLKDRYPLKSFLKLPAIEAKAERAKDLNMGLDPEQFPEMRAKDPELAALMDERLHSGNLDDLDVPHPDGPGNDPENPRTWLSETAKMVEKY